MRIIIYGAGAIGSIIGGHLFRKGYDVVLIANSKHVEKINENGLRLVTPEETYILKIPAYKEAKELIPFCDEEIVLLTAKSQHTLKCLGQLKNACGTRTLPIFCCQNSIYNEPLATRIFDKIYGVLIVVPGIFLEYGVVVNPIIGNSGFIEVGVYPRGKDELAEYISSALRDAGFASRVNEWVMKAKAAKCIGNLANAIGAITDGKGDSRELINKVRNEAIKVWGVAGMDWEDFENFERRIQSSRGINKMPEAFQDQQNFGSSWQSLMRGTGNIEAEQLNGDIVTLGRLIGVSTPFNETLWKVADEMAINRELPGKYSAEELIEMVKRNSIKS